MNWILVYKYSPPPPNKTSYVHVTMYAKMGHMQEKSILRVEVGYSEHDQIVF